jgi:hypothetical protein
MNHIDFVMPHNNNQGDNDYSFVIAWVMIIISLLVVFYFLI